MDGNWLIVRKFFRHRFDRWTRIFKQRGHREQEISASNDEFEIFFCVLSALCENYTLRASLYSWSECYCQALSVIKCSEEQSPWRTTCITFIVKNTFRVFRAFCGDEIRQTSKRATARIAPTKRPGWSFYNFLFDKRRAGLHPLFQFSFSQAGSFRTASFLLADKRPEWTFYSLRYRITSLRSFSGLLSS